MGPTILASGFAKKDEEAQVNMLVYSMGDEADDILHSFGLSTDEAKRYDIVKAKFDGHFVKHQNVIHEWVRFNQRVTGAW